MGQEKNISDKVFFEEQPMMNYGFVDIAGNVWSKKIVDAYNNYTIIINKTANIEMAKGCMMENERDFYLDQRSKFYKAQIEYHQSKKEQVKENNKNNPL